MAKLEGVNVEKLQGGLNRLATSTDNHVALIVTGIPAGAIATAVNNSGKGVVLTSVFEAEQLGINESFDSNNGLTVYRDIVEFFRLAPEATLYLFNSAVAADVKTFINQNKEIKGVALYFEYDSGEPNLVATINAQQVIINELAAQNRLIDFITVAPIGLDDFSEDLFALSAPNVSVCIACMDDSGVPSLGSFLGMQAVRKISENIGSVDIENKPRGKKGRQDYPLTDDLLDLWPVAYLTDGTTTEESDESVINNLKAKGYIFAASYEGYEGVYFENSYTCVSRISDFAFIEHNRVWNKAARIIRATLLPRVKSKVKKEPTTGYIASTTVSYWISLCNKALEAMIKSDDISGFEVEISQKQIVNDQNPCVVKALVVADGIVHEFTVQLGLTNSI